MMMGRFGYVVPVMAIAGSHRGEEEGRSASAGTFPTDGALFVGLMIGVILIVGGLPFSRPSPRSDRRAFADARRQDF